MEEIEELRAKAIASMPFSTNLNSSSTAAAISGGGGCGGGKFGYPRSKEEGEVSSGEGAELATCSVAPTSSANLGESIPYPLKNNAINTLKNALTARSSTTPGMQLRPSAMQNYQKHHHKHFRRKLPFRSRSNQALHWHAKESNNNLVISFSDDDSGSGSEELYPEKGEERMDGTSIACDSRLATTLLPKPTNGIEREPDGSKPIPNKGFANHGTVISSVDRAYETSCGAQGPSVENGSRINMKNIANKTSASRELGHVTDSTMTDQRLELLRHQIAARENKLKVQNSSAPAPQNEATVGSDSEQHCLHAMKPEAPATGTNLEFEVDESSRKRLKHEKSSTVSDFNAPSKPETGRTFHADYSCTQHQFDSNNTIMSSVIKPKDSFLALSAANLHDESLSENVDVAKIGRSEKLTKKAGVSNLPSNYVSSMHLTEENQQMTHTTDALMPLKTSSIYKKSSDLGGLMNIEANTTEEGSMSFQSLVKMEELHDKELEEAQEYRCKCEIEERNALKAYRKAQRSLVEANDRCAFLYAKRELFSAKVRTFDAKASNSICPSDWLCQQIPYEDQFYEPDASTSVHRDNGPLDGGAVVPTHNPNISTDDDEEDFPLKKRAVESRSDHVDIQIEKPLSLYNSQDYELLEASLRSELVARLGLRASSKMNETSKRELGVEKRAGSVAEDMEPSEDIEPAQDMERSSLPCDMMPISDANQTAKFDGIERTQERSSLLGAPLDFKSLADASSNEELHCDLGTNNSFPGNSGSPTNTAVLSLPASGLHSVCKHTYMIFPGYHNGALNMMRENDYVVASKDMRVSDFISDNVGEFLDFKRPAAPLGFRENHESSVKIDPFWPLCMFELRGKCNDEECPWQHMKAAVFPKLREDEHSNCHATTCLPNGKLDAALLHVLPIPTYQIGPYLIKADPHQSQSVLARSNWPYHQRGFCASFLNPFSVQRILPLDAPCLQLGDDPVADDYSWNRLSLYYRNQDVTSSFTEQIKQGSADVEQLLEMALDQFDGDLCESNRRKALSLLSHAIESYPSSVILWVVFLNIYYKNEKAIGQNDLSLHAVRHNKDSYELWLLYINSRVLCEDRLNAYDKALNALSHIGSHEESKHLSPYILDIFLQMIDFLSMSGRADEAISRIRELSPPDEPDEPDEPNGNSLRRICSCLEVPDRCLLWTSCAYFIVYEKLPEPAARQFESAKDLPFGLDWPAARPTADTKSLALEIMQSAMTEMMASHHLNHRKEIDQASMHFLAVSHVKCQAALLGFPAYAELLEGYLELLPSSMELALMAIRCSRQHSVTDLNKFSAFEEALYRWPKETPGIQCLWNQYAEYLLTNNRIDLAERLMARWFQNFPEFSACLPQSKKTKDEAFGFLNLFLYSILQQNGAGARSAIDRSMELASPEDHLHFVKEQASSFMASKSQKSFPVRTVSSLIIQYLSDPRSNLQSEPLSRRFIRTIKKPRIQQLVIKNILGPVPNTSTLVNSVLKMVYGPSLLPEKLGEIKETVSFVEVLMEITPANYELALSVYRICSSSSSSSLNSVRFWASSLLINSIFKAIPVAPELIWLEAGNIFRNSESFEIAIRFFKQAVSVYPFSVRIWQSYADLCANNGGVSEIIEAAKERGIELNNILN